MDFEWPGVAGLLHSKSTMTQYQGSAAVDNRKNARAHCGSNIFLRRLEEMIFISYGRLSLLNRRERPVQTVDRTIPQYIKMCLNVVSFLSLSGIIKCWAWAWAAWRKRVAIRQPSVREMADVGREGRVSCCLVSK